MLIKEKNRIKDETFKIYELFWNDWSVSNYSNWDDLIKSKGYGTASHREGIKTYGGHELHRELYIQNWLPGVDRVQKPKSKPKPKNTDKCLIKFN